MATPCIVPAMHVAAGTGRVVAGRYYLQDPIGRGAMGTVWRARDALLARDVAVKEVLLRAASTPEDMRVRYERTLREARTAARLNHPAVVTVFDVVEADGRPWIVMELVQARSLEQILAQDGPLPPHRAADIGSRLLGALATAHAAGILHRDVKPSNVLIGTDDRAVLTDFGIATLEGDPGLTQVGMVMGTPGFTAPERVRGEPATPASDLWSLGATLYAAVEGHGPFDQLGSSLAVLSSIANEDAPRPRSAGQLGPAIGALLRRDPSTRPDASAAARLLAAAVIAPTAGRPAGGGYQEALGHGGGYRAGPSQAGPSQAGPSQAGPFRAGPFQVGPSQAARFPAEPFQPQRFPAESVRRNDYVPESSSPVSRPTAPEPPATELPAWMNSPPDGKWPEGPGRPRAGRPAGAGLPDTGLPDTGLPDTGPAASRPAGHPLGRHGNRPAGRRWPLAALGAVAVICAGVLGGLAIGHAGRSSLPPGYHWYMVSTAAQPAAAGFRMAVPDGWQASTHGLVTDLVGPEGRVSMQVDRAPFEAATAPGEVRLLEERALTDDSLPGYRLVALHSFPFRGSLGADWEFTWHKPRTGTLSVLNVLFKERTGTGGQAFRLQVSGPAADRTTSRATFTEALRTFGPR
jgi:eukaryotic-like serine/threonine-protein kinase